MRMNINFSDQKCLTSITRIALRGETGPDGQNIFGHTDVLINDFLCTPILVHIKTISKDNSYFYKKNNTRLSFDMVPVSP